MSADTTSTSTPVATKPTVYLEADDEIRGQKYVCLSFLTPSAELIRNKKNFFFSKFLEFYAMDHRVRGLEGFVLGELRVLQDSLSDMEIALANAVLSDDASAADARAVLETQRAALSLSRGRLSAKVAGDMDEFVKANLSAFKESDISDSYDKFMLSNETRLEDEFHAANNFQTSMHGLKVRGVYASEEQAKAHAKNVQKKDPYFNVYVADVGQWLPWDPTPDEIPSEYTDMDGGDKLNTLMKAYKENVDKKNEFFETQKTEQKAAAAKAAREAEGSMTNVRENRSEAEAGGGGVSESKSSEFGSGFGSGFGSESMRKASKSELPTEDGQQGLFSNSGPTDLAIQRRMEAAAAAAPGGVTSGQTL